MADNVRHTRTENKIQEDKSNDKPPKGKTQDYPVVDKGTTVWLQVLVGFLFTVNAFGFISAFGVFQAKYIDTFRMSPPYISWIGSTPVFLFPFFGMTAGRLIDAGYFYPLMIVDCALQVIGIFTASFAKNYWQVLLLQGVAMGLGNGLVWTPGVWLTVTHFNKKKGLAIGVPQRAPQ